MGRGSKTYNAGSRPSFEKQFGDSENEGEDSSTRKQIGITITAEWIENLDVCKIREITLKMEYKGDILAISDPIPVKKGKVDIDLTGTILVEDNVNLQFLDDMLSNPVLLTIMNSGASATFPSTPSKQDKDLNRKPLKGLDSPITALKATASQNILGICNLDISGLLLGKKTVRERLPVDSDRKVPPMDVIPWVKLPKLWVNATTEDWDIFNEVAKKMKNILGITIESIYNIPEAISEGSVYEVNIPSPSLGNRNNVTVFPGGVVMMPKEANTKKKWLNLSQLEGNGARSKYCVLPTTSDVINTVGENYDLEKYTKKLRPVLQWNMWKNTLMTKSDVIYFYSKLIKSRVWPVEICSGSKPKEAVQKSAKSDKKTKPAQSATNTNRDHFLAFINLSALLYPGGVTKTRVAAQLFTYSYSDLVTKFGSEYHGSFSQPSVGTFKSKAPSERSKASVREPEEIKDSSGSPVFAEDGSPMFIIVEVELLEPLTPKQNPELLLKTLKDYVSLKGEPKKKTTTMESTEENFTNSVKDMVSILSQEYEKFFQVINENSQKSDDLDVGFEDFFCRSENFYKMQATLENKVVELIYEKFGPMSQRDGLPDVYIYLVEKMHKITNNCLVKQEDASSIFNIDDYQLYAEEALEEGEFELAKEYLFLKLSHQITNPDYWLDCAVFFNIFDQTERAIEAVREALYLNFNHQMGLLLYALLMEKIEDRNAAELAFQALLAKYPDYLEGWLAFWLYYQATGNPAGGLVALQMAKQLNCELSLCIEENSELEHEEAMKMENEEEFEDEEDEEEEKKTENEGYLKTYPPENKYLTGYNKYGIGSFRNGQTLSEPLSWTSSFSPPKCIYIRMAVFMMRLGFYEYSSMCLTQCMYPCTKLEKQIPYYHYYVAVNNYLLGRYHDAIPHLRNFVKEYGKDCFVWSLMGHCYYKLQNHAQAIACYEYVIESFNRPDDIHLIYLRMGYYYLKAKKYSCAKKVLLIACKYSPSPKLWKGLGIACLRMSEAEEAETAFSEANYLDNRDSETWAYLALTNSLLGRLHLFKNCYAEAKKRNLQNRDLIQEVETCALLNSLEDEELITLTNLDNYNV